MRPADTAQKMKFQDALSRRRPPDIRERRALHTPHSSTESGRGKSATEVRSRGTPFHKLRRRNFQSPPASRNVSSCFRTRSTAYTARRSTTSLTEKIKQRGGNRVRARSTAGMLCRLMLKEGCGRILNALCSSFRHGRSCALELYFTKKSRIRRTSFSSSSARFCADHLHNGQSMMAAFLSCVLLFLTTALNTREVAAQATQAVFFTRDGGDRIPWQCKPDGEVILDPEECAFASRKLGMGGEQLIASRKTDADGWPEGCYRALLPGLEKYTLVLHKENQGDMPPLQARFFAICKTPPEELNKTDALLRGARGFYSGNLTIEQIRHPSLMLGTMDFLMAIRETIAEAASNNVSANDVTLIEAESYHRRFKNTTSSSSPFFLQQDVRAAGMKNRNLLPQKHLPLQGLELGSNNGYAAAARTSPLMSRTVKPAERKNPLDLDDHETILIDGHPSQRIESGAASKDTGNDDDELRLLSLGEIQRNKQEEDAGLSSQEKQGSTSSSLQNVQNGVLSRSQSTGGVSLIATEQQMDQEPLLSCSVSDEDPMPIISLDYDITINYKIFLQTEVYLDGTPSADTWLNEMTEKLDKILKLSSNSQLTASIKLKNQVAEQKLLDPDNGPFSKAIKAAEGKLNAVVVTRAFSFDVTRINAFFENTVEPLGSITDLITSVAQYGAFSQQGAASFVFQPRMIAAKAANLNMTEANGRGSVSLLYALALEVAPETGKADYTYDLGVASQQMNTLMHITEKILLRGSRIFTPDSMRNRAQALKPQAIGLANELRDVFVLEKQRRKLALDMRALASLSKMLWKLRDMANAVKKKSSPTAAADLADYSKELSDRLGGWWSMENVKTLTDSLWKLDDELVKLAIRRENYQKQTIRVNKFESESVKNAVSTAAYLGLSAVPGLDKVKACEFEAIEKPTTTTTTTPKAYVHAVSINIRANALGSTQRLTGSFVLIRTGATFDGHALEDALANYLHKNFATWELDWPRLVSVPGLVRRVAFPDCNSLRGCLPLRPSVVRIQIGAGSTQMPAMPQTPAFVSAKEGRTRIQGKVYLQVERYPKEFADTKSAEFKALLSAMTTVLQDTFRAQPGNLRITEITPLTGPLALDQGRYDVGFSGTGTAVGAYKGKGVITNAASTVQNVGTIPPLPSAGGFVNGTFMVINWRMTDPEFDKDEFYGILYKADKFIDLVKYVPLTTDMRDAFPLFKDNATTKDGINANVTKIEHIMMIQNYEDTKFKGTFGLDVTTMQQNFNWMDSSGEFQSADGNVNFNWQGGRGLAAMTMEQKKFSSGYNYAKGSATLYNGAGQMVNKLAAQNPTPSGKPPATDPGAKLIADEMVVSSRYKANYLFLVEMARIPETEETKGQFGFVDWFFKRLFETVVAQSTGVEGIKAYVKTAARTGYGGNQFFLLVELASNTTSMRSDLIDDASDKYIRDALGMPANECSICNQMMQSSSSRGGLFPDLSAQQSFFPPGGCDDTLKEVFLGSYADHDMLADKKWAAMLYDMCMEDSYETSMVGTVTHIAEFEASRSYFVDFTVHMPFEKAQEVRDSFATPELVSGINVLNGADLRGIMIDGQMDVEDPSGTSSAALDSASSTGGGALHIPAVTEGVTIPKAFQYGAVPQSAAPVTIDVKLPGPREEINFETVSEKQAAQTAMSQGVTQTIPLNVVWKSTPKLMVPGAKMVSR
ncbi:unnamed protein product [Amoebophrya sp. A120]|nr:unnamed protein product [Amoebophrya sp. A120]|eukprot:GSA120T00012146001.1